MSTSSPRQHTSKARKPTQPPTTAESAENSRIKSRAIENKKSRQDDPVNSTETRRRNQKGYS